ncbi:hypothetical protein LTR74_018810, partial [Friedmanniomyces endolithicus]
WPEVTPQPSHCEPSCISWCKVPNATGRPKQKSMRQTRLASCLRASPTQSASSCRT